MIEITTPENTVKEELSRAFIHAVAASIGCQISVPGQDYNAVDLVISAIKGSDARVDLQLKAKKIPNGTKKNSATVHLHRNNLFTARSLKRILARSHDWAMDRTRWERLCRD